MPFPVLGSNSAVAGGYEIDNSLRFNDADSPKLTKTFGSAGSSVRTFTISFWVKKCLNGKVNDLCGVTNGLQFIFRSGDDLRINFFTPGTDYSDFITNQLFRDPSAWYHIVLAVDTTQGTEANRKKLYVNGSQVTSFATQNFPTQNRDLSWNSTAEHQVGYSAQSNDYSDIYLSDFNSIDGQALDPTYFGETNNNGVWVPKEYGGTYGNSGFFLEFQNSGSLGTDTSGNGNNFTATNLTATDQTTDTPTNNWCTLNSVEKIDTTPSEGNCQFNGSAVALDSMRGTIGMSTGKWYWEVKVIAIGVGGNIGIATNDSALSAGGTLTGVLQQYSGFKSINGWSNDGSYGGFTTGDIIGFALDMDSGSITFYKNGSSQGVAYSSLDTTKTFFLFVQGSSSLQYGVNFGNPSFSISSGNSDENGYGSFEYAVPSGYYALCTKNLAEYG